MKTLLIIVIISIVVIIAFLAYFDVFKKIEVKRLPAGGEIFVYEEVTGDYKQTPKVMDRIYYDLLNNFHIETFKGCGIYYDNPRTTSREKLRSHIGCIVETADSALLASLRDKYKIEVLPKADYLVTEFPYKGALSVMVGIFKVYPAVERFSQKNGYTDETRITEIYDIPAKRIEYRKDILQ